MGPGWHMRGYGFGMESGGGIWAFAHIAFWLLLLLALVIGVFAMLRSVRSGSNKGDSGKAPPTALDLLDQRYARGEIDREDYLQRKQDIAER
ncbi:MAG: SHOCT domain-containing protein [Alphaproteobacteria bacterium]|nr:SHOCT domain-containing protein [Alphaproteobacteria bacterium]